MSTYDTIDNLDSAQDYFHFKEDEESAKLYLKIAQEYFNDEMISEKTLNHVIESTKDFIKD